jgi:peptide deformylase
MKAREETEGRMTIRKITEYPEEVLAQVGDPVEAFDGKLERLVADMFETMYADEGVGLAAPQVGLSLRLFVMDCDGIKLVAANPEIIAVEGEQEGEEGCLSVGKIGMPLKRAERVRLRAQDIRGQLYEHEATGLAARCFQHETDHCDGLLFIDRLTPLKRDLVKKRFQKMKKRR